MRHVLAAILVDASQNFEQVRRMAAPQTPGGVSNASGSTDQMTSPQPKASTKMISTFQNAKAENLQEIIDAVGDNLELQNVVKQTIREYNKEQKIAASSQLSLQEMVSTTATARKRKNTEGGEEDTDGTPTGGPVLIDLSGEYRRGQYIYGQWNKKHCDELLAYVDERTTNTVLKKISLEEKHMLMEMCMELVCFGDSLDRVGNVHKAMVLPQLKAVYVSLGSRFQHVILDLQTGQTLWPACSPWRMISQVSEPETKVTCKLMSWANNNRGFVTVVLDRRHFFDDKGPFKLVQSFSVRQCAIESESTKESYGLIAFAPQIKRRLARRTSDENGSTNTAIKTFAQSRREVQAARAAAKAKAQTGTLHLGGPGAQAMVVEQAGAADVVAAVVNGQVVDAAVSDRAVAAAPPPPDAAAPGIAAVAGGDAAAPAALAAPGGGGGDDGDDADPPATDEEAADPEESPPPAPEDE